MTSFPTAATPYFEEGGVIYTIASDSRIFITILQPNEFAQDHMAQYTERQSALSSAFSHAVFLNVYNL